MIGDGSHRDELASGSGGINHFLVQMVEAIDNIVLSGQVGAPLEKEEKQEEQEVSEGRFHFLVSSFI